MMGLSKPLIGRGETMQALSESGNWARTQYSGVIIGAIASQITSLSIVYSTVHSGADERKHHSSASLAFVWGIHRTNGQ